MAKKSIKTKTVAEPEKVVPKKAKKKTTRKVKIGANSAKIRHKTVAKKTEKKLQTEKSESTRDELKSAQVKVNRWKSALEITSRHPKTAALLLGFLLTAALPPFYYTLALFVAFSGVMFLACKNTKMLTLAAIGYWFGFGYFAGGFYWIGNALLVDAAHTGWLYPLALFLNGAFFGVFTILPLMATKFGQNVLIKSLWLAAVWGLVAEILRGYVFTGFPWNPISSVLTFSPAMMQILALGGTYGISQILVLLAALPAIWLLKPTMSRFSAVGAVVLCGWLTIWIYGGYVIENRPYISNGNSLIVRLVQPSIAQSMKWNRDTLEQNLQTYVDMSIENDNDYVDFTIWGETASPFDLMFDYVHNRKILPAVPKYGYLITGMLRRQDNGYSLIPYNSLAVINPKGGIEGWYDKSHLVPFGEYVPLRKYLPKWVRPLTNEVAEFGRGEKFKTLRIGNFPDFAPLICYEIIFSDAVVKKGAEKPTWAVVLTNDGWYGMSSGPYQHLAAAQMRAAEEGITIVRSANSGISAVINPYGEIVAQIPLGERGVIDAKVKTEEARQTLFGKYGNKIALTISATLILWALLLTLFSALFAMLYKSKN